MSQTLSPILKHKPVIISAILTILSLIYKLIDAAGNAEFLLQKLGLNEDAARFLGSGRAIDVFVAVSLLALVLSLLYYANRLGGTFELRSSGQKRVSTVPLARQPAHEDCQRDIGNLRAQVQRLLRDNETCGVQISARDGQITALQDQLKELKWLTDIAKEQSETIHRFVSIQECHIRQHELFRHDPYLEFWILIGNRSVFDLQLTDIEGVISFYGRELTEGLEWKAPNRVVTWGTKEGFVFRQRLNPDDVVHLLNERGDFRFDGLKIPAVDIDRRGFLERLERIEFDNIALANDTLLEANPKLEIVIKNLTATMIVNLETFNDGALDGIVTMSLVLRNRRQNSVVIDSFHLELSVDNQTSTVSAELGEIWEKKYIDKTGTLKTEGAKLKNLADRTPITIRGAEVVGDVQFTAADIGAKLLNHPVSYKLIVVDTTGEKHPVSGLTGRRE